MGDGEQQNAPVVQAVHDDNEILSSKALNRNSKYQK